MGTDCMPIMHARFERLKGSGFAGNARLEGVAALLPADAAGTPATAMHPLRRSSANLGDNSPFYGKHRCARSNGATLFVLRVRTAARFQTAQPIPAAAIALPTETIVTEPAHRLPQPPLSAITHAFVPCRVRAAIEQPAVPARHWLQRPAVASVPRAQLAAGACTITATTMPRKPLTPLLH